MLLAHKLNHLVRISRMPRWVARIMDICHTPFLRVTVTKVAHPGDVDRMGNMHAPVVLAREHPRP